MTTVSKYLLLCGNTIRAKAYLTSLKYLKGVEVSVLLFGSEENIQKSSSLPNPDQNTKAYLEENQVRLPDFNSSITEIINETGFENSVIYERDVNSEIILEGIAKFDADYVIFAGYGGQILSPDHFTGTKKYIHCHPGWLPHERGSTTLYYSILHDRELSVTAFYMTAKIDDGEMILRQSYPIPQAMVNIDVYVDNCLRADTLVRSLNNLIEGIPSFKATENEKAEEEEYYVIHPLLKHIALLSLKTS